MIAMFGRRSMPELEAQLHDVEQRIASHPLSSERVVEAHKLVEEHRGKDQGELSRELSERGLPSLKELGQIQLRNTASWWRLHYAKNRLSQRLRKRRR